MIRLSILDQSPVVEGKSASEAIAETMDLVTRADAWGYGRYWFAEHHASASFASASPEIMMAYAAARTSRIRLGSGGILLGHAAPLRIAESLRSLQVLSSGRIDAGFGRAPGGDQRVMHALGERSQDAWQRLDEVLAFLRDVRTPSNNGGVVAVPENVETPEVWVLGTSASSAVEAGKRGLAYAFGAFIDPTNITEALASYHANFEPSVWNAKPRTLIATVAFVGETEADASRMARSSEQWFVESFLRSKNVRFPVVTDGTQFPLQPTERLVRDMRRASVLIGSVEDVAGRLHEMEQKFATSEFSIVTITDDHAVRCASYERLATIAIHQPASVP
ncbi:MAG: MsnO8 family LLM class oxidoreductase [Candidatus Kapabacteria bacterium]|nr:MsnO8 family LLM class oxidoreductase [Candidatus Kapabacteria bacterium]